MVEVGLRLAQEQSAHEELLAEQRHLQLDIGRLKEPRRLVEVARSKLGMTPQPAAIRTLRPAPRRSPGSASAPRHGPGAGPGAPAGGGLGAAGAGGAAVISRWTRLRLLICGVVFGLCALKIGQRAYELQVGRRDELRAKAEDQHLRQIELAPQRGRILDHKGVELAASAQFDSIACVSPRRLLAAPGAIEKLAAALKLERKAVQQSIGRAAEAKRYFVWLKRTVSPEESARVRALQLPGLHFTREPKRVYPAKEAGGTVVGHTNVDGRGDRGGGEGAGRAPAGHGDEGSGDARRPGAGAAAGGAGGSQEHRRQGRGADAGQLPDVRCPLGAGGGGEEVESQGRHGHRDGPAQRRHPGDGQPAQLRPGQPGQRRGRGAHAQPVDHRPDRTGVDHEDPHSGGHAGRRQGEARTTCSTASRARR